MRVEEAYPIMTAPKAGMTLAIIASLIVLFPLFSVTEASCRTDWLLRAWERCLQPAPRCRAPWLMKQ
jgi:hypothetical protein